MGRVRYPTPIGGHGIDFGTLPPITMLRPQRRRPKFVETLGCGLNCDGAISVTFAGLAPCPAANVISFTGINGTFPLTGYRVESFGCDWLSDGSIGTYTVATDSGPVTFNVDAAVRCLADENKVLVGAFEASFGSDLIFVSALETAHNGPNTLDCSDVSAVFHNGTFSLG